MTTLAIIILILLVLNLFFDMVYVYFRSKYIEIMEKQNKLLWEAVEQSKVLMAESIMELRKSQDGSKETMVHVDGKEIYMAMKKFEDRRKPQ